MKDPKLFLVSAPSGAGKSSLIDAVLASAKQSDLALELSISYTTRSPRKGESNGNQYFFISEEDFINKKNSNFFLEHAKVHDNWYGTSVDFVESTSFLERLSASGQAINYLELSLKNKNSTNNKSKKGISFFWYRGIRKPLTGTEEFANLVQQDEEGNIFSVSPVDISTDFS